MEGGYLHHTEKRYYSNKQPPLVGQQTLPVDFGRGNVLSLREYPYEMQSCQVETDQPSDGSGLG
ncbi:hypothetical protein GCM10028825_28380 [Spirosoma agri]